MGSATMIKTVSTAPVLNNATPFTSGAHIQVESTAGSTLYGANHPGRSSTTKFQQFKQLTSGNYGFELAAGITAPQNTTGGALSVANTLRVIAQVNGTIYNRLRGDQDPTASTFVVGAGGGTMAGDTTMVFNAAVAVGTVSTQIKSSGANVKTLIVGDRMTIVEGTLTEVVTVTRLFTANGTTAVTVSITPTVNAYTTAAVLTFQAATGKAIIFGTPSITAASIVEVWVLDAADVITLNGGALTAGQNYDLLCYDAFIATAATDIFPL